MQHRLEFNGQSRSLGPGVLTIGSGREASWRVDGRGLERLHVMVSLERDGRVVLTRGDEVAWVELNGQPLATATVELRPDDEVRLGDAVFRLAAIAPQAAEAAGYLRDVKRERWYRLGDITAIGRDLACAVLILDPDISRTHAEVVREAEGYVVHPRRGVTIVNTRRITAPTALVEGDEVTVGQTTLRFTSSPPPRGAAAPARLSSQHREVAQMQTTFMSPLAVREQLRRRRQRRIGAVVAGVVAVAVVVGALVSAVVGGRSAPARARAAAGGAIAEPVAASAPAPTADTQATLPAVRLPDSVAPIEQGPMADEPITAGGTKRPRP